MSERRRALISVSDKRGVADFARELIDLGFEIVSTGGTLKTLESAGLKVKAVADLTGAPEILGGRVKTLHPAVFGGILARRDLSEDLATLDDLGIETIDLVAVNLYPFAQTIARPGAGEAEASEHIDIGGASLLRAAAKNHRDVYAVVDPADYGDVLSALADAHEATAKAFRKRLAAKVFRHCSDYDRAIAEYLERDRTDREEAERANDRAPEETLPERFHVSLPLKQRLRYGENPHQQGAFYAAPDAPTPSLASCRQLQGKELSYNNYLDGEAALEMIREFDDPTVVILKHANPCGVGRGETALEAWTRALECDPESAFGGIVGLNRTVDAPLAEAMTNLFIEVMIAPDFDDAARAIFAKKKNLRLLETGPLSPRASSVVARSVSGGLLVQTADATAPDPSSMKVASRRQPDEADWEALLFGWKVVRWVKSNAIVYMNRHQTVGIGAGQMSRIDAARLGLRKARLDVRGAFLASDGFFPFRDVIDLAAESGIRAVIQPGGSIRDEESIRAADEHDLILVMTGRRHFRH